MSRLNRSAREEQMCLSLVHGPFVENIVNSRNCKPKFKTTWSLRGQILKIIANRQRKRVWEAGLCTKAKVHNKKKYSAGRRSSFYMTSSVMLNKHQLVHAWYVPLRCVWSYATVWFSQPGPATPYSGITNSACAIFFFYFYIISWLSYSFRCTLISLQLDKLLF